MRPLSKAPNPQLLPWHSNIGCPLPRVCVHCGVCALGWVKCIAQIQSMGHHTWPHVTSLLYLLQMMKGLGLCSIPFTWPFLSLLFRLQNGFCITNILAHVCWCSKMLLVCGKWLSDGIAQFVDCGHPVISPFIYYYFYFVFGFISLPFWDLILFHLIYCLLFITFSLI